MPKLGKPSTTCSADMMEDAVPIRFGNRVKRVFDLAMRKSRRRRTQNVLLSYPRSGNHLVRFFIELMTGRATAGEPHSEPDVAVYQNRYAMDVPFDVDASQPPIYHKYHFVRVDQHWAVGDLILLVRNPREVLLRHSDFKIELFNFAEYYRGVDFFLQFAGRKKLFFYEDMIEARAEFVRGLYDFLGVDAPQRLDYILANLDPLYETCRTAEGRYWGGARSVGADFYYKQLADGAVKREFDAYVAERARSWRYGFLNAKYGLDAGREVGKSLVVAFCDFKYVELAVAWQAKLERLGVRDYLLVASDWRAFEALTARGLKTEFVPYDGQTTFWEYRLAVLADALKKYGAILHCDVDALWRADLRGELEAGDADINFSQGTVHPAATVAKHGFVLCCGFFYVRQSERTLRFFDEFLTATKRTGDDQIALNELLDETRWEVPADFEMGTADGLTYRYYKDDVRGYNARFGLNLSLIAMRKVQRQFLDADGAVHHIYTKKDCATKIRHYKKLGLL